MVAAAPLLLDAAVANAALDASEDQLFVMNGVGWAEYDGLLQALGERSAVRVTYCEGTLELMSPGGPHEWTKTLLARLVEAYAEEAELPLSGYGSMTTRRQMADRGVEPDECYALGTLERGDLPELAIEVIQKSGAIDKLSVYEALGVPEVWIWKRGELSIHLLGPSGYAQSPESRLLAGLDAAELTRFVRRPGDQTTVVRAWRAWLRDRRG